MIRWLVVGTVLQTAMVLVGHWVAVIAQLFGLLGVAISLAVGFLWAREGASDRLKGVVGGAVVGGGCALVGIAVSWALGDVAAIILAFGTAASAVAGGIGGLVGALTVGRAVERTEAGRP